MKTIATIVCVVLLSVAARAEDNDTPPPAPAAEAATCPPADWYVPKERFDELVARLAIAEAAMLAIQRQTTLIVEQCGIPPANGNEPKHEGD